MLRPHKVTAIPSADEPGDLDRNVFSHQLAGIIRARPAHSAAAARFLSAVTNAPTVTPRLRALAKTKRAEARWSASRERSRTVVGTSRSMTVACETTSGLNSITTSCVLSARNALKTASLISLLISPIRLFRAKTEASSTALRSEIAMGSVKRAFTQLVPASGKYRFASALVSM